MTKRFSAVDVVAVALCAGITVGGVMWVNQDDPEVIVQKVPVTVAPTSCARALDAAADVVNANTTLMETANKLGPLTADAYAAGLAGNPPDQIVDRVARLNVQLDDAYVAAAQTPKRFVILTAKCKAERTTP